MWLIGGCCPSNHFHIHGSFTIFSLGLSPTHVYFRLAAHIRLAFATSFHQVNIYLFIYLFLWREVVDWGSLKQLRAVLGGNHAFSP
jgi:hypothetical protein